MMAPRSTHSPLQLKPSSGLYFNSSPGLPDLVVAAATSKEERRIVAEARKQALVVQGEAAKLRLGEYALADMQRCTAAVYAHTANEIMAVRDLAYRKDARLAVEGFTDQLAQLSANQLLGALEVSAQQIGRILHRSLYLEPERAGIIPGLFKRLFG